MNTSLLFQVNSNGKSLSLCPQWTVRMYILWSGCSPAVWWWWSVCPCRVEWTSITLRKAQRFATTATPTTSSPSGSTDRYGQAIRLKVKSLLLHTVIDCSYFVPAKRLVVCLEESVYIHNIKDMKLLKTLLNTPLNPSGIRKPTSVFRMSELILLASRGLGDAVMVFYGWEAKHGFTRPLWCVAGLCALSVNHSNSYLAYPGSATIGEITLYDANNLVRTQWAAYI